MSESLFVPQSVMTARSHSAEADRTQDRATDSAAELEATLNELQFGDFHQRWDAAKRLPSFGQSAVAPLLSLLPPSRLDPDRDLDLAKPSPKPSDDDWELLWFVARILGDFQHPAAISALVNLLETAPDPEIATVAAMALTHFGEAALPALTALLNQPTTRLIALQALAQLQQPAVLPVLLEAAQDGLAEVRQAAISALSQLQVPQATQALWDAFRVGLVDPAAAVRRAAVMAIGARSEHFTSQIGAPLAEALSPLLKDDQLAVRQQAALALGRVNSEVAVTVLGLALSDPGCCDPSSNQLQVEILHALAWTERPAALAQIQQYLHLDSPAALDPALNQEIVAVLGRVTRCRDRASQILLELLSSTHPIAQTVIGKQQIALSLGQLQQAEAIDPLIDLLADSAATVRLHAASALKQFAAQAVARMQQRLADPDSTAPLKAGIMAALQGQL